MVRGLARLGFASYEAYLASPGWRTRRLAAFRRCRTGCIACGSGQLLHAHHVTYANLGRETGRDLVVLCQGCHEATHRLISDGHDMAIAHDLVAARAVEVAERGGMRVVRLPPGPRVVPRVRQPRKKKAKKKTAAPVSKKARALGDANDRLHRQQVAARERRRARGLDW
jgi:hypothetical protein